jgi:glycosyltransferase involved in cell wall biosynthesis
MSSRESSQPTTILHIFSGDLWAGAEVMVFNLLSALKDYPDIRLITLSLNDGVLTEKLKQIGIQTHVIKENKNSFPRISLKTFKLAKSRKIDVIHSHRYKENLLGLILAKTTGVKQLITTMHGLSEPSLDNGRERVSLGLKTRMDYFLLKHFFSHVVAVSQEMKSVLVRQYGFRDAQVDVIYNGIDSSRFVPFPAQTWEPENNRLFYIGTVGRMVPVKGFDLFLEVAAETKKRAENVRFRILGDGPLKDELILQAEALGIKDIVEFLPPKSNPVPFYQSLDVYLNTSHHEGIPLSILEAMSCGKPVVAPRVGGIPEIISSGHEGLLLDGRSPRIYADACLGLIDPKSSPRGFNGNPEKIIEARFSSRRMADAYYSLYSKFNYEKS